MPPRILLLQARNADDPAREDERRSFAAKAELPVEQFVVHDLLDGPPSMERVFSCDALMVGGSGDYYVSKQNLPQFPAVMDFFNEVVSIGHPMLASCFGFHLLAKALGGDVIYDLECMEVGTFDLTLTDLGTDDELFNSLPRQFRRNWDIRIERAGFQTIASFWRRATRFPSRHSACAGNRFGRRSFIQNWTSRRIALAFGNMSTGMPPS